MTVAEKLEALEGLVGQTIEFDYPRHNFLGIVGENERRHVHVQSVRLLEERPLDPLTRIINPLLRRGPALVIGYDLDRRAERKFYLTSMTRLVVIDEQFDPPAPPRPKYMVRVKRAGTKASVVGPFTADEAQRVCDALPTDATTLIPPGHSLNRFSP